MESEVIQPTLLVVGIDAVGWKTYRKVVGKFLYNAMGDSAQIAALRPGIGARALYKLERHLPAEAFSNHILYNIFSSQRIFSKIDKTNLRHVLFVDQAAAGVALRHDFRWPYSIGLDVTGVLRRKSGFREKISAFGIRYERKLFEGAENLFPMSNWVRDSLIHDYGINPNKITVIPPCLEAATASEPLGALTGKKNILFVGNDFVRKGGPLLVETVTRQLDDSYQLVIASSEGDEYKGAARVLHLGRVPNDILRGSIFPHCTVQVLPTTQDMSPWVIVEANSAGLPSIASNIGGIPELVGAGNAQLLLEDTSPEALARTIREFCEAPERVTKARRNAAAIFSSAQDIRSVGPTLFRVLEKSMS